MPARLADDIAALDGIAAVQIGVTDLARTSVPTIEKGMRKDEGVFAGLLIIEALDEAVAPPCVAQAWPKWRPTLTGDIGDAEVYQGHVRARCPHRRFWIMPKFSLAALTVLELAPPELVEVAAACGYDHVGIRLLPSIPGGVAYPLMEDAAALKETLARLDATGVTVADLEVVAFRPETEVAGFSAFFETGARLGAKNILVAGYDPDLKRFTDRFAKFCEAAAQHGLTADLEFMPWTSVPDLRTANSIVAQVGQPNAGVLVDALHFDRSNSLIGELARIPAESAALLAALRRPGQTAGDDGRNDACRALRADVSGAGRHRPGFADQDDAVGYSDQHRSPDRRTGEDGGRGGAGAARAGSGQENPCRGAAVTRS